MMPWDVKICSHCCQLQKAFLSHGKPPDSLRRSTTQCHALWEWIVSYTPLTAVTPGTGHQGADTEPECRDRNNSLTSYLRHRLGHSLPTLSQLCFPPGAENGGIGATSSGCQGRDPKWSSSVNATGSTTFYLCNLGQVSTSICDSDSHFQMRLISSIRVIEN